MRAANYSIRETDPFAPQPSFGPIRPTAAPIVGRLQAIWKTLRETVMKTFPMPPGLPKHKGPYLKSVDEIYKSDAYHSLSIEGYNVTQDLVDRVRGGNCSPSATSLSPMRAPGRAVITRTSQHSAITHPPAMAWPFRYATVGPGCR